MPTKILNKEQIIEFLRENKKFLEEEFGVTKIALFGSYARDEQKKTSDIDLLIETNEYDFFNRCALREFLEKKFKKKVDIGYFNSVRTFIMRSIKEDLTYA